MKKRLHRIGRYIKNNKVKTVIALIVVLGAVLIATKKRAPIKREYVTIARTTVSQEVNVTGHIEPSQQVALSVQSGGKVSNITAVVGEKVTIGQTLLSVNTADLQVRLARGRASLEKAQIILAKQQPKTTASDTLAQSYENGFNAIADTFLDIPSIVTGMEDILGHGYLSHNTIVSNYGTNGLRYRNDAETKYYNAEKAYTTALKKYNTISRQSSAQEIEETIIQTYDATKTIADAVKTLNNFVDYVKKSDDSATTSPEMINDKSMLASYTSQTNNDLSALLSIKNTIKDSREGISDELYNLDSINLDIKQATLDIQDILVQISNRSIKAPINGTITNVGISVGETVSANSPVITLISSNQFQIEANIPESDIAKVTIGATATIILDAYGSDVSFKATVVSINPSETLLDGVATYKTTLQFIDNDDRIKSGMTADITIEGTRKENVLAVPQRAVTTKDGKKYVQILRGENVEEVEVTTGLRGSDGNIEVAHGVTEGDMVIVFIDTK